MSPSSHTLLLLSINLSDPAAAAKEAEEIIRREQIDWNDLLNRADTHFINPQLEDLLNRLNPDIIPGFVLDHLREANRENLLRQLRNLSAFFETEKLLREQGVTIVPFKGFWLASEMYGDIASRFSGDVDLFFSIADFDKVFDLMVKQGFRPETYYTPQFIRKVKKKAAEYNFEKYEGKDKTLHFEFHWKMGSSFHGMDISLDDLSSQIITGRLNDKEIKVFTPSANLLLTVMHHGGKDPYVRLKHVLDIGYLIKKDIDWEWVIRMAKRFDVEKLIYIGVNLSNALTGTEIPPALADKTMTKQIKKLTMDRLEAIAMTKGLQENTGYYYDRLLFQLRSRTRISVKVNLVMVNIKAAILTRLVQGKVKKIYLKKRYGIISGNDKPED